MTTARDPGRPIFMVWGTNRIDLRTTKQDLEVRLTVPGFNRHWRRPLSELGLTGDAWHAFALTLESAALRIYVDGKQVGLFEQVPPLPRFADDEQMGIMLGGEPHGPGDFWVSDLRISRTA